MAVHNLYLEILEYVYKKGSVDYTDITHFFTTFPFPKNLEIWGDPAKDDVIRKYLERMEKANHIEFNSVQDWDLSTNDLSQSKFQAMITVAGRDYYLANKQIKNSNIYNIIVILCSAISICISIYSICIAASKDKEIEYLKKRIEKLETKATILQAKQILIATPYLMKEKYIKFLAVIGYEIKIKKIK